MRRSHVLLAVVFLSAMPSFLSAQSLNDPLLKVEQLVSGLDSPTAMAFIAPDDILVLQKNDGQVRRVLGGVLQPSPVRDVAVDHASERGLLGMTVHPQFPSTPFVYLYFTQSSTGRDTSGSPTPLGNRVYRYTWDGTILTDPTLILDLPVTPGPNHDGGIITFGPDGKLYVVIGDLNRNGQLQNFPTGPAPDDTSVILRLNDDGSVPTDNPFFSRGGNLAKYYAYGVRNAYGLAFDPVTEQLWMTENGPDVYDEINLVEPGFNSGWERLMGPDSRDPQGIDDLFVVPGSHYSDPEFSWLDQVGPTALVFLNSTALGLQYANDLFVADINNGTLYHFPLNAARDGLTFQGAGLADLVADDATELDAVIFGTGFGGITDLKVGPDGLLYVVSFRGSIYVISPLVVNDLVSFEPTRSTFESTPDPTGCPAGFVGTFRFEAPLTNISARSLSDLAVAVTTLTNGNLLQNADGGPGGVGARLTVPQQDGFTDGVLGPDEFVDVPFIICLTEPQPFRLEVDVLGEAE
jgi:aldose sugar dehydrogenase